VFTHDERLPEAVRRLNINATILSVTRRPKSVVELRAALDPVRAHIEDALALVHTTELPKDVLRRLVPGFCRAALAALALYGDKERGGLSRASHHHAYELPPAAVELTAWVDIVDELVKRVGAF
jgi:hypothetical protein